MLTVIGKKVLALFVGDKSKKTVLCVVAIAGSALAAQAGIISQDLFELLMLGFGAIGLPASLWAKLDKVARAIAAAKESK